MMRRFGMLAVIITCAVECLAGDGREGLSALQSELDQFQGARRAVENNPGGSQADKLRKLFADETIKRLYNKYPAFPSATWESYVADLEKELKSVERKCKMPRYSPGADESMIEILEPTLAQLKKEYEGLGKKDARRKEMKKRIDDLQSQLDTHKKLATVEKEKWENKSAKIAAERDVALTKIAEKVNGELDAFAELHYLMPIKKLKEKEAQARKEQVAKELAAQKASRKKAEAEQSENEDASDVSAIGASPILGRDIYFGLSLGQSIDDIPMSNVRTLKGRRVIVELGDRRVLYYPSKSQSEVLRTLLCSPSQVIPLDKRHELQLYFNSKRQVTTICCEASGYLDDGLKDSKILLAYLRAKGFEKSKQKACDDGTELNLEREDGSKAFLKISATDPGCVELSVGVTNNKWLDRERLGKSFALCHLKGPLKPDDIKVVEDDIAKIIHLKREKGERDGL